MSQLPFQIPGFWLMLRLKLFVSQIQAAKLARLLNMSPASSGTLRLLLTPSSLRGAPDKRASPKPLQQRLSMEARFIPWLSHGLVLWYSTAKKLLLPQRAAAWCPGCHLFFTFGWFCFNTLIDILKGHPCQQRPKPCNKRAYERM